VVLGRETSPIPNGGNLPRDILAKYSGKSKEVSLHIQIDFSIFISKKKVFSFNHIHLTKYNNYEFRSKFKYLLSSIVRKKVFLTSDKKVLLSVLVYFLFQVFSSALECDISNCYANLCKEKSISLKHSFFAHCVHKLSSMEKK
jgi:hypothetical protein